MNKLELKVINEGKEYVRMLDILNQTKELGLTKKYIKESMESTKISGLGNIKWVLVDDVKIVKDNKVTEGPFEKSKELNNINSQEFEEDVCEDFYDLLDKGSQGLWDEIFDRTMELDIESAKYNEQATLLLDCEEVNTAAVQFLLASEYITCIEKLDDDTYEIYSDSELFIIDFI